MVIFLFCRGVHLSGSPISSPNDTWGDLAIENFFCKIKEFKRIAMRSDKTDQSFSAIIYLCSAVINSR